MKKEKLFTELSEKLKAAIGSCTIIDADKCVDDGEYFINIKVDIPFERFGYHNLMVVVSIQTLNTLVNVGVYAPALYSETRSEFFFNYDGELKERIARSYPEVNIITDKVASIVHEFIK